MSWPIDWNTFHLLRPWWLLALLPALWLAWRSYSHRGRGGDWSNVVDATLLPHLLEGQPDSRRRLWPWLLLCGWLLAIFALSGPSWQKQPQPLYIKESALVILLDLSRSMDASDITPSRLTHARHKVLDILAQRQEGQTGLVVYTDEAFVVSPLTDDHRTIANLVPALSSDIMPSQGSQLSVAIERANRLLDDAGFQQAKLLVISDGVNDVQAFALAEQLPAQQRSLSVLGIGSSQGSPIALSHGGFLTDQDGAIVISKADHDSLQQLAQAGGGRYSPMQHDGSDLSTLLPNRILDQQAGSDSEHQQGQQQWRDEGVWLIFPLLLIAALAFRRGWLLSISLCFLLIQPQPSYAFDWGNLWQTPNQQAEQAMQQQHYQQAAETFEDPLWQATALYRAGDYQQAAEKFAQHDSAIAHYNRGNALAQSGQLPEAIQAYQQSLELDPEHQDSQFNMELVQSMLEQQQQDQASNSDQSGEEGEQQQGGSQQQNEEGEPQQGDTQQQEQGSEQQQSSSQQQSKESDQTNSHAQQEQEGEQQPDQAEQQEPSESDNNTDEQPPRQTLDPQQQDESKAEQSQPPALTEQAADSSAEMNEQQQYMQQWLRRIPDDPGGLLRRKFELQHQQQPSQPREKSQPW